MVNLLIPFGVYVNNVILQYLKGFPRANKIIQMDMCKRDHNQTTVQQGAYHLYISSWYKDTTLPAWESQIKDMTVSRQSYLKHENTHTRERRSLFWDRAHAVGNEESGLFTLL